MRSVFRTSKDIQYLYDSAYITPVTRRTGRNFLGIWKFLGTEGQTTRTLIRMVSKSYEGDLDRGKDEMSRNGEL